MAYGANILTNPSAETQDTTGWVVNNVTVEENTTEGTRYIPIVDDYEKWSDQQQEFILEGGAGDYCFVFASDGDADMYQILYASDVGEQPESFQFNCRFKLINEQPRYDNTVFGFAKLAIAYDDNTFDYFHIPFIIGVKTSSRYLLNYWVLVQAVCDVASGKTLEYIKVSAECSDFIYGLRIDYMEIRKET